MKKFFVLILFFTFASFADAKETPLPIYQHLPNAEIVGKTRHNVFIFQVYDISLYSQYGRYSPDLPFAICLKYLKFFQGDNLAERFIQDIQAQGLDNDAQLDIWHSQLLTLLPDVYDETSLSFIKNEFGELILYKNDQELGKISDTILSSRITDMWLGEAPFDPNLKKELLELQEGLE